MRTIRKRPTPNALTQWREPRLVANRTKGMECTYDELRRTSEALEAVEYHLFAEQGGLCAYTEHRIGLTLTSTTSQRDVNFHLEHLVPQTHCAYGQDTDYANLVACWPRPNCGFEPAYGARKKGSWPSATELSKFVSPLRGDCSARFRFDHRGNINEAQGGDEAAKETITKLGLNHHTLIELRRAAIRGALNPGSRLIKLAEARKLLQKMRQDSDSVDQGNLIQLTPFCSAIQSALEREIRKLEAIRKQK